MAAVGNFCAFCILETHMKGVISERDNGQKQVLPLSVILLVQKVGNGAFEIGRQSDAQEFLFNLLDSMTQASFGYLRGVPNSYEK